MENGQGGMILDFSKRKSALTVVVCTLGILFAVPNILSSHLSARLPVWLRPVNLGLDLKGGSHLLIEIGVNDVAREQLTNLAESVRGSLRRAGIYQRSLTVTTEGVTVFLPKEDQHPKARRIIHEIDRSVRISQRNNHTFHLSYSAEYSKNLQTIIVQQSMKIVRQRVDESGIQDAVILRQGNNRLIVELPGVADPARIKHLIGRTAKLTLHLVDEQVNIGDIAARQISPGTRLLPRADSGEGMLPIRKSVVVSGEDLVDAQPSFQNGQPVVTFRFNPLGGRKFGKVTQENLSKRLAIVLDGKVISAPVIREPILGGSGVISGRFTTQDAQDLALLLRAGSLPAPLTYLEERTVGPSLGADSIRAGAIACVVGLGLVVAFMGAVYGMLGLFADLALLVNLVLLIGFLSAIGATLTLPGIAGIVLTLGMAVDANVLIYERVREEKRNGLALPSALEAGFQRAFTTILDSNVTTLVAALLLFQFGAGPVRGFAVTLGFGILTSMFSALMVTGFFLSLWVRNQK